MHTQTHIHTLSYTLADVFVDSFRQTVWKGDFRWPLWTLTHLHWANEVYSLATDYLIIRGIVSTLMATYT